MGLGPSKEKIRKILEDSMINPNTNEQKYSKIEYKYKQTESMDVEENTANMNQGENQQNTGEGGESFIFSQEITQALNNPRLDVKKINKFPYIAIGTITSQFPGDQVVQNTCFLIDTNVVVTLASNIDNKNKGGKAESITTTFSKEKVKIDSTHIIIQGEEEKKGKKKGKEKEKSNLEGLNAALNSKLAVILYDENIGSEWIGAEVGRKEDLGSRDIYAVFSLGLKGQNSQTTSGDDSTPDSKKGYEQKLREILVSNANPFLTAHEGGSDEEKALIKCSPGSPLYYKDYNSGAYVIAIVNENFDFQYFDKPTMKFLADGTNKGKLLRKKSNKGIDEDNIISLDLQRNDFGPLDIKYLTDFDLKNLRILDLSSNSIKPQGAFYLSQGKFNSLESLNLNFNEIGDEGLNHIANGFFSKLNSLYLFHDNISDIGIKHLVKAEFINNLIILSLSENPNIGDIGVRVMKEHKGWNKLSILNLNYTGLTDIAVSYLGEASMPKLKKLNIQGNKFTEQGKASINALRMNHIHVSYRTEAERKRDRERESKNKENNDKQNEDNKK